MSKNPKQQVSRPVATVKRRANMRRAILRQIQLKERERQRHRKHHPFSTLKQRKTK